SRPRPCRRRPPARRGPWKGRSDRGRGARGFADRGGGPESKAPRPCRSPRAILPGGRTPPWPASRRCPRAAAERSLPAAARWPRRRAGFREKRDASDSSRVVGRRRSSSGSSDFQPSLFPAPLAGEIAEDHLVQALIGDEVLRVERLGLLVRRRKRRKADRKSV